MNLNDIRNVALAAAGAASVGFATVSYLKTSRAEKAKREEIRKNAYLDFQALLIASEVIQDRIDRGDFRDARTLAREYDNEIAFQKIAIREN